LSPLSNQISDGAQLHMKHLIPLDACFYLVVYNFGLDLSAVRKWSKY
jgi:hypothetical protein